MIRETTPSLITEQILHLCEMVVPGGVPYYVDVDPWPYSKPNNCFQNVSNCIQQYGGTRVLGRAIWQFANILVEAEAHAIWKAPDGQVLDISPHSYGEKKILFLLDPTMVYKDIIIPNVRLALTDSPLVKEFIDLGNEKDRILATGQNDTVKLQPLIYRYNQITRTLHTEVERNERCPCQSGDKYKKCCGKYSY